MSQPVYSNEECPITSFAVAKGLGVPLPPGVTPSWASSDPTIGRLVNAPDNLSAELFATGTAFGDVTVTESADLGAGVTITGQIVIPVLAGVRPNPPDAFVLNQGQPVKQ